MKILLTAVFSILLWSSVQAQEVTVGDTVQYQCNCLGAEWVRGKVERVGSGNIRVRYGNLDNQVVTLPVNSPKLKIGEASRNPLETIPMNPMQRAFQDEARGRFQRPVQSFAHYYDSRYFPGGSGIPDSAEWREQNAQLAELDSLCRTRYQGLTDWKTPGYLRDGFVDYRFGLWCEVAANRVAVEKKARIEVTKSLVNLGYTDGNLDYGFNQPDNPVPWETQQVIWDRAKWRAEKIASLRPRYAGYKVDVPADATAKAEARADELKAIVLRDAPGRSYKQPQWRDAAVEAFVRGQLAKEYPGVQVVKIGLDYKTWVVRKNLDYVASDDTFRYYKVSYNSYKRGTALLKIPGRPLCQMNEWVVGRGSKGMVNAGIGGGGVFMRCD